MLKPHLPIKRLRGWFDCAKCGQRIRQQWHYREWPIWVGEDGRDHNWPYECREVKTIMKERVHKRAESDGRIVWRRWFEERDEIL